ncbi:hypothetical protein J6S88_02055 [bacterium]|nr:hypothetical protein [bacterium]
MKKLILLFTILLFGLCSFGAEKLPIKIAPVNDMSTIHDEAEVGDIVEFKIVRDVIKNDKVFIHEGTKIYGQIDYIKENGWCFDNAQIEFKNFEIIPENGKILKFESSLTIDGFEMLQYYYPKWKRGFQYIGSAFRGKEIDLANDKDVIFNIWYNLK